MCNVCSVGQLGERVLPEIVPILEHGLLSTRSDQRQGVCIGLGEILLSTSRDAVLGFADGLVIKLFYHMKLKYNYLC